MINLILGMLIALLPLITRVSQAPGQEVHHENLLFWAMIAFLLLSGPKKRQAPVWLYALYGVFCALSVWNQVEPKSIAIFVHTSWVFLAGAFVIRLYEVFDRASEHWILDGMVLGCLIQSTWSILDRFGIHWEPFVAELMGWGWAQTNKHWNPTYESIGTLGGTNWLSVYIAVTAIGMLRPKRWVFLPVAFLGIFFCKAITGGVALGAGIIYWAWIQHGRWAFFPYVATSAAFLIALFSGSITELSNGRYEAWVDMLRVFPKKGWVWGMGPGWFYDFFAGVAKKYPQGVFKQEHNEFLACLFAFGGVGLVLVLGLFAKASQGPGNALWKAVLFAAFVSFFGHFTMHQATVAVVALVALAASMIPQEEKSHVVNMAR